MSANNVEIELKFPLCNPEDVVIFLSEHAELKSKNVMQKDNYFTPLHRDFLSVQYPYEWLRVRESDKGTSITYKHFYPENAEKTDYCDEFETDVTNAESIKKIFKSLDFKQAVIVEKTRTTWKYKDVEIAIDNVKDLGYYIEIEALKHFENPKDGKQYLYTILDELNADVGEEDLRGYPFRLLEKRE